MSLFSWSTPSFFLASDGVGKEGGIRGHAGENPMILDVRHLLEFQADPQTIPGAIFMPVEQLEKSHTRIPCDCEVVLCCNCPNETSSAHAALMLQERGIPRVRPLAGGFNAWRKHAYPLESREYHEETPSILNRLTVKNRLEADLPWVRQARIKFSPSNSYWRILISGPKKGSQCISGVEPGKFYLDRVVSICL